MDVEHGLELLVGHAVHAAVPGVSGVVHDDVEATAGVDGVFDEGVADSLGDEVGDERGGTPVTEGLVDRAGGFGRLGFIDVGDDDAGAVGGEHNGGGAADAARSTGDDGYVAREQLGAQGWLDEHAHRAFHTVGRFSANARSPSCRSSERITSDAYCIWLRHPSASSQS